MRNLVITDRDVSGNLFNNSVIVNLNNITYSTCTGALECLKNNGICYFKDDMNLVSRWMNESQLIIYVTQVKYGCFDVKFKQMLERLVVNLEPYYTVVEGETCHLGVSQLNKKLIVIGYGEVSEQEKQVFEQLLEETTLGYAYTSVHAYFCQEDEIEDALQTFGGVDHD